MPAAWKAIVRDGYAMSTFSCSFGFAVAGGICARCNRHNVVLQSLVWGVEGRNRLTSNSNEVKQTRNDVLTAPSILLSGSSVANRPKPCRCA